MLMAFPVSCAAVWFKDLERLFDISNWDVTQRVLEVVVSYANAAPTRKATAQSVLQMSADHLLGVGFGEVAVSAVFPLYAKAGLEQITDMQNMYLQVIAECGYLGLIMLLSVMLMFVLCVLTYLRWGGDKATKVRVVAGLGGVVGVLVMGFMCNPMSNVSLFGLFWLVIGLTVACLRTQYETHMRAVQTHAGMEECSDVAFRTK